MIVLIPFNRILIHTPRIATNPHDERFITHTKNGTLQFRKGAIIVDMDAGSSTDHASWWGFGTWCCEWAYNPSRNARYIMCTWVCLSQKITRITYFPEPSESPRENFRGHINLTEVDLLGDLYILVSPSKGMRTTMLWHRTWAWNFIATWGLY